MRHVNDYSPAKTLEYLRLQSVKYFRSLPVFLELRSPKTALHSEKIMSVDKYPSIHVFSPQMEGYCLQISVRNGDYCLLRSRSGTQA